MRFGCARRFLNASGAKRFFHGRVYGVKLMIARHFLRDCRAVVLEHEKMADKIEKSPLIEHAAKQNLELRHRSGSNCLTGYRAPRHEAFAVRTDGSDTRIQPIGNDQDGIIGEERWNLRFVRLQLM